MTLQTGRLSFASRLRVGGLLQLLLAGCVASPCPDAVLAVLDGRGALDGLQLSWIQRGMQPLRAGLHRLCSPEGAARIDEDAAVARLRAARVVLVADLHDLDPCRRAFGRAVILGTSADERDAGCIGLAFEALPPGAAIAARTARHQPIVDGFDPLRECFAAVWPWPVSEMAVQLRRQELRACPLLAAGREEAIALPAASTPDAERVPRFRPMTEEEVEGDTFHLGNRNAKASIDAWLEGGVGRRVFVLYGALHLLGEGNLAAELRAAGRRVLVLVPFLPEWEAAIRRRGEPGASQAWFEVAPDVLRAPLVGDDEVLALPPRSAQPLAPAAAERPPR